MLRRRLKALLPNIDKLRENRSLGMFGEHLFHPALWHLHRRSVAGGVAAGLFCGLIPGPLQVIGSAAAAIYFRVNLPVALVTTFYTNPFTIVPLYIVAYRLGCLVMPGEEVIPAAPAISADVSASLKAITEWAGSLGTPLLVGVPLLAALLAAAGYLLVRLVWNIYLRTVYCRRRAKAGAARRPA